MNRDEYRLTEPDDPLRPMEEAVAVKEELLAQAKDLREAVLLMAELAHRVRALEERVKRMEQR